jgi:hypothetical protein
MAIDPLLVLDAQEYIEAAITEASANGVSTIPGWMWQLRAYLNSTAGSGGSSGGSGVSGDTSNLATESTLLALLAELRDDTFVTSQIFEDTSVSPAVFYREDRVKSQNDGTISTVYTRLSDNATVGSLPAGTIPVQGNADRQIDSYRWRVKSGQSGTGFSAGDYLTSATIFNTSGNGSVSSNFWYNLTTSSAIAAPDPTKIENLDEKLLQSIRDLLPSSGTFPASQSGTWNIGSVASLPNVVLGAGSSTIGAISNTTFAATQSGTWNIGSITTLPNVVLGAGSSTIGAISNTTFAATQSGTWNIGSITTLPNVVLGAGSSTIGAISNTTFAATQSGTWNVSAAQSGTWIVSPSYTTIALDSASSSYTSTNGSEKYFTVPSGKEWQIISVYVDFATSATAGNRQIAVRLEDAGAGYQGRIPAGVVQSASLTRYYSFAVGMPDLSAFRDTNKLLTPLPPQLLAPGSKIRVLDTAAIATSGDTLTVRATVAERSI